MTPIKRRKVVFYAIAGVMLCHWLWKKLFQRPVPSGKIKPTPQTWRLCGQGWKVTVKEPLQTAPRLYWFADPKFIGRRYIEHDGRLYLTHVNGESVPLREVDTIT